MDDLVRIPCVIMRGALRAGLISCVRPPSDPDERDSILISVMGSGHELEIDGIGQMAKSFTMGRLGSRGCRVAQHRFIEHSLVQPGLRQRSSLKLKPDKAEYLSRASLKRNKTSSLNRRDQVAPKS